MSRPSIQLQIINPLLGTQIPLPDYATTGSAAVDLRACLNDPLLIPVHNTRLIPSGIAIGIGNLNLVAVLAPRSGLGIKHGIVLANGIGVIDSDYTGEIMVALHNRGEADYTVEPGERICQMLFLPVTQVNWQLVDSLAETARGAGGFGHTGRQ